MDRSNSTEDDFAVDLESRMSHSEVEAGQVQSVRIDVNVEGLDVDERNLVKEKCKKTSNKKSPKPPRPPRGPSLDAADQRFIKEITELTMLKRIRTERIKALKKMKAAKSSSASSSLFATMFTVVFCCVIFLQGISNRTSSYASIDGSPSPLAPEPGLISVQFVGKAYATNSSMPASGSPSVIEQVSGQDSHDLANKVSG